MDSLQCPCIEIPPGFLAIRLISSTQVPLQAKPLNALNFNMSEYMSDEHVLGRFASELHAELHAGNHFSYAPHFAWFLHCFCMVFV